MEPTPQRPFIPYGAPLEQIEDALFQLPLELIIDAAYAARGIAWVNQRPIANLADEIIWHEAAADLVGIQRLLYRISNGNNGEQKPVPHRSCAVEDVRLMLLWGEAKGINWLELDQNKVGTHRYDLKPAVAAWIEDVGLRMHLRASIPNAPALAARPSRSL